MPPAPPTGETIRAPLVALEGAGLFRAGRWLVRHVDLTVGRGEIVTLIGPNGSGKSTSVKLALGVLAPDEGQVRRAPGLRVGYVPQKTSIDRALPLTVTRLMGLTARHAAAAIASALARVGAAHLARAQVQDLSGGEMQRVLIARAMIGRPDLLVLDEPVQGVDFSGEVELYNLIDSLRQETGCGVLLISHDLHVVMARTDRVICLNGHVCCSGTPDMVSASAEYRALFGPRAAGTLALYRHDHNHAHHADGTISAPDGETRFDHHRHGPHCDHGHDTERSVPDA